MTGYNDIAKAAKLFGQSVKMILPTGGRYAYKAFIQPVNYKNKVFIDNNALPTGEYGKDSLMYIGPCSHGGEKICHRAIVEHKGERYVVNAASRFYFKDKVYYMWAVLTRISHKEI